jgi:hypothetical protein
MKTLLAACTISSIAISVAQAEQYTTYRAPSGNIGCITFEDDTKPSSVTCEVFSGKGLARYCKGQDRRPQFTIADGGKVQIDCMNLLESEGLEGAGGKLLPYGGTIDLGIIRCGMSKKGIYCRNGDGHGFELSRSKQRLF